MMAIIMATVELFQARFNMKGQLCIQNPIILLS